MPVYTYKCLDCGEVFEIIHSIRDDYDTLDCPYCMTYSSVEKLISLCSFKLNWRPHVHPGIRTPVKCMGNQLYDEQSYTKAKSRGHLGRVKNIKANT